MNTLEILNNKIEQLKKTINQLDESEISEKIKLEGEIIVIEECLDILEEEDLIAEYDFSNIIDLVKKHDFDIKNLSKILTDIQIAINVKQELGLSSMSFSTNQKETLIKLKEVLCEIKEKQSITLDNVLKSSDNKKRIKDLEKLRKVLEEKEKKYVTEEMFESFYETIDWQNISVDDTKTLLSEFYHTRNLKGKINNELANFEEIEELYKSFLGEEEFEKNDKGEYIGKFGALLNKHKEEVRTFIDIENTREILNFFKEKGILIHFYRNPLLKVSLFAKIDYVKTLYNKITNQYPDELEIYFEDKAATLWVCDKSNQRMAPFRVSKEGNLEPSQKHSLYSECHIITDDEFRENIKLLNDNKELFSEKYDIGNIGAHLNTTIMTKERAEEFKTVLKLITSSSWIFRKNMELFKLFGIGTISRIPITSCENNDIENKLHLAIELGLLNPPMTKEYLQMEQDIIKNDDFQSISRRKKLYNQSIRNYFARATSILSKLSVNNYIYLIYKMKNLGKLNFYNQFFSQYIAGEKSGSYLTPEEEAIIKSGDKMDEIISDHFLNGLYGDFINNYEEYVFVIHEFSKTYMKTQNIGDTYYNPAILEDELIQKLEREHKVMDILTQEGKKIEIPNDFVYLFEGKIISRYKVLHNATILKARYGYLNEDMLMTSIAHNSFLDAEEFMNIAKTIKESRRII